MKKGENIIDIVGLVFSVIWGVAVFIVVKPIGLIFTLLGKLLSDVGRGVYGRIVQVLTFLAFGALVSFVGYLGHFLK